MRKIKLEKLTKSAFAPFGEYYEFSKPSGYTLDGELHNFYPDRLSAYFGKNVGFSPLIVKKPDEMKITQAEYHTTTCEILFPLTDDMILHVAPPSNGKPVPEHTKAFLVPKFTMVKLNACVWHLAPLPAKKDNITVMVVLPECTYINDCTVINLKEDEQFVIEK